MFIIALLLLVIKLRKNNKAISKSEQEIRDQANQLDLKNQLLLESEAFKAKLFSIISHDLKSPIHSLNPIVQMSLEKQLSKEDYGFLMENLKKELDYDLRFVE